MSISTDVKVQWVEGDTVVGTTAGVAAIQNVTASDPSIDLILTSFMGGSARILTVTTTAAGSFSAVLIEGTDENDKPVSESIEVSTAAGGGTSIGEVHFKTITSAVVNGGYTFANSLSMGMLDDARKSIADGQPIRLKGYTTAAPMRNTNFYLEFHNGYFSQDSLVFAMYIPPLSIDYPVPDEGTVFKNGLYLQYVVGSLVMMNVFYA